MTGESSISERFEAVFEVLAAGFGGWIIVMMALVITGVHDSEALERPVWMALVLLAEAAVTLLIIVFIEASSSPRDRSVFSLITFSPAALAGGIVVIPLLYLVVFGSATLFIYLFPQLASDGNPLLELIRTPADLAAFMAAGILSGGIKEEVQRAFILLRFERYLGGLAIGLILWSIAFGLGHYQQGWSNAFSAGILGIVFGLVFLWKRNLLTAICAHAFYDVTVLLIFWNYYRN